MSEAFICHDALSIVKRAVFNGESFSKTLEYMAEEVRALIDRASREGASARLVESLKSIHDSLLKLREDISVKLEGVARSVDSLVRSDVCGLGKADICTFEKLPELVKAHGYERALVECFKKNIVACRDVTEEFIDLEKDEKVLEVVFYDLDGSVKKSYVKYRQDGSKIKGPTRPVVQAAYERCLGAHVEV